MPPPTLVFVRPQAPGNLGALARVMSNFGCTDFRYTGGFPAQGESPNGFSTMDWAMSRKGETILKEARCYPDLATALTGMHLVIGSSGRDREFDGGYARPHVSPEEALQSVAEWTQNAAKSQEEFRWAFVLGPEDDGLSQQESSFCQKLVRLSTVDEAPSMNIAMAAGCFLYHWHLINSGVASFGKIQDPGSFPFMIERTPSEKRVPWADESQKDRFLSYLMETIARTKFLKYPDVESVRARVKRWIQAAPIPLGELLFAFEIVYHFRAWGAGGTFEARNFLTDSKES